MLLSTQTAQGVNLADFGLGTVVGAIIAGAVAIIVEVLRGRREKKNRFLDEKRRAYKAILRYSNLLVDDVLLLAAFRPIAERLPKDEAFPPAEGERARSIIERVSGNLGKYDEGLTDAVAELTLLDPASSEAAQKMMPVIKKMTGHLVNGEAEKAARLESEYRRAWREFRAVARRDLGTDT